MYSNITDSPYSNITDSPYNNSTDTVCDKSDGLYGSRTDKVHGATDGPLAVDSRAVLQRAGRGLISAHSAQLVETVVQAGVLPVLVLIGVTANIISMAVFCRQGFRDRINVSLFR